MKAIILVGGEATRLRPLTPNTPKAMLPVLNTPFLSWLIRRLKSHGTSDIILTQSHFAQAIKDHFGDGRGLDVRLNYVSEAVPLGTAGAVKNSEALLDEPFLALNGDVFTDLDNSAMIAFHRKKKALVTIALTPVADPSSYGLIETDSNSRVLNFLEKPRPEQITTNMINAGTYVLEPEVLKRIPPGTKFSFERELFPQLLAQGEPVYAYSSNAYWIDMGTPENYLQLHKDLLGSRSTQYNPDKAKTVVIGEGSTVDPEAEIEGPVIIDRDCTIKRGAKIKGPVVIGTGTVISEDALVDTAIIWQEVMVGPNVTVKESIVAHHCRLEAGCRLLKAVLGDHVTVLAQSNLEPDSRIPAGTVAP
ncbi:MAG: NDP-sugar synthase [Dehalococcoidales bacterium]